MPNEVTYSRPHDPSKGRVPEVNVHVKKTLPVGGYPAASCVDPYRSDNPTVTSSRPKSSARDDFFSKKNVWLLQTTIQGIIWRQTRFKIDRQSDDNLRAIMTWVYHTYGHNTDDDTPRLNYIVLEEVIPIILTNMRQYVAYLRDASTMKTPMQLPAYDNIKGEDVVEFPGFFAESLPVSEPEESPFAPIQNQNS